MCKQKEKEKKNISEFHVSLPTSGSLEETDNIVTHQIFSLYTSNQLLR